jgi:hypothetical protein
MRDLVVAAALDAGLGTALLLLGVLLIVRLGNGLGGLASSLGGGWRNHARAWLPLRDWLSVRLGLRLLPGLRWVWHGSRRFRDRQREQFFVKGDGPLH